MGPGGEILLDLFSLGLWELTKPITFGNIDEMQNEMGRELDAAIAREATHVPAV